MVKLILVRHALTVDNQKSRLSGHIDSSISEEGKELVSGNIPLTVEEVEAWGDSMEYIENLVLDRLNLTKKQIYL